MVVCVMWKRMRMRDPARAVGSLSEVVARWTHWVPLGGGQGGGNVNHSTARLGARPTHATTNFNRLGRI
jgi:hypothetical protein